jgi:hypothetical protein
MPIRVYYKNGPSEALACTIRPTPFVSIDTNFLITEGGDKFGATYTITLTGTIIAHAGMPFAANYTGSAKFPFLSGSPVPSAGVGPDGLFDDQITHVDGTKPLGQNISNNEVSTAIFTKQRALRALFAQDGQRVEISDFADNEPTIVCFPRSSQISFQEGPYVDICSYTITLECDTLLRYDYSTDIDGILSSGDFVSLVPIYEENLLQSDTSFAFIQSFADNWNLEIDQADEKKPEPERGYIVTHNLSAVGKKHYFPSGDVDGIGYIEAWRSAKNFVQKRVAPPNASYPNKSDCIFGSGLFDKYKSYNRFTTEQVDIAGGSYSISDRYLFRPSGDAKEEFTISIGSSVDTPYVSVSIDGQIEGLDQNVSGVYVKESGLYASAVKYWNQISNSGQFGFNSQIYKRCKNLVAVQLNTQPKNITIGSNENQGTISYNLGFDNRPTNIISGVLAESISVNDTYPGDVFSVIPIIGRKTGPILQYIGCRTEYKRDVSINLTLDYMKVPYGSERNTLLLKKPSVVEPTASQLSNLINELSPANESGIRKYFISPPSETWNPKDGTYSLNISWTYELNR